MSVNAIEIEEHVTSIKKYQSKKEAQKKRIAVKKTSPCVVGRSSRGVGYNDRFNHVESSVLLEKFYESEKKEHSLHLFNDIEISVSVLLNDLQKNILSTAIRYADSDHNLVDLYHVGKTAVYDMYLYQTRGEVVSEDPRVIKSITRRLLNSLQKQNDFEHAEYIAYIKSVVRNYVRPQKLNYRKTLDDVTTVRSLPADSDLMLMLESRFADDDPLVWGVISGLSQGYTRGEIMKDLKIKSREYAKVFNQIANAIKNS